MSNTAILSFVAETGMWEASYGGNVISSSTNKSFVRLNIEKGNNKKANLLNVTKCEEAAAILKNTSDNPAPALIEFDINERFQFLEDYVDMVSQRQMNSVVICGSGGLGKSYTVFKQMKKNKLINVTNVVADCDEDGVTYNTSQMVDTPSNEYVVVKGYTTAKGLYRTLYENRNRVVVFDDCDSALENATSANILKAALDSYDKRVVTWNAEASFGGENDLPKSFEFKGGVVFISNLSMGKIPQAIISRSAPADVSMTRDEVIIRMRMIVSEGEFMNEVSMEIKNDALNFIASNINNPQIKTINLRTLIAVTTNRRCKPDNWERLSLSMMIAAR